ncbi:coil containing protein [Vibrio phage 1.193.O._10N.286.52.C6]|nr:coil containing protein [Vibrio phage 1.193.O._10N.286.52.C6]
MSRYSLNHGFTCPEIDKSIADAKDVIHNTFYDTLEELCPVIDMNSEAARAWVQMAADSLYDNLEPVFEDLRSSNEDLRGSAETQITELTSELEELEYKIQELENGEI